MIKADNVAIPHQWVFPLVLLLVSILLGSGAIERILSDGIRAASPLEFMRAFMVCAFLVILLGSFRTRILSFRFEGDDVEVKDGRKVIYSGPRSAIVVTKVSKRTISLNLPTCLRDLALPKKRVSHDLQMILIGKKGSGEPGATDNPDDAQR